MEIDHAGQRVSMTTAELYRQAMRLLRQLQDGVRPGESDVVLCFDSVLDFIPAAWACIFSGYWCAPWQLLKTAHQSEIDSRLRLFGQKLDRPVLLGTDRALDRIAAVGSWPGLTISTTSGLRQQFGAASQDDCESSAEANDGALLMVTSGTTASSKIAMLSHRTLLNRLLSRPEQLPGRNWIFSFPFDGVTGLWIIFPGQADNIFLAPDRLAAQPLELLTLAEEFHVSGFSLSTSIAARICEASETDQSQRDLSSLAHIGFGGEMIVPDIILRLQRKLVQLGAQDLKGSIGYGLTETGLLCQTQRMTLGELTDYFPHNNASPVRVGSLNPGWSLRIVDQEGNALPEGEAGNIEVWSDTKLFSGYRNDIELTRASFTKDGWFKTGDVGIRASGQLAVTGRHNATIIINARKISLDAIEAPVRRIEGIRGSLVAAAPVRLRDSVTDELALFFVAQSEDAVDDLCRSLVREIAQHAGVTVKHLVPLPIDDFPLTPTGKVKRDVLVELYQAGRLAPHELSGLAGETAAGPADEARSWLTDLWRKVLKLKNPPSPDRDFFELGGDSLAAAELIFAIEEKFSCELPLDAFFERPTIANIETLIARHAKPSARDDHDRLLHKLQSFSGSWQGERLFKDSFVVGFNTGGCRLPIFWVCQEHREASQLAKHLGRDQPFFAMRSCVGIIPTTDYTADVIETVCNRYLWEVLALQTGTAFILGGDCQGGMLALAMARRLTQIERRPLFLALQEWTYSSTIYTGPTLLIYGEESYTAEIYRHPESSGVNWVDVFPCHVVASVPGKHGELSWQDKSVAELAKHLSGEADRLAPKDAARDQSAPTGQTERESGSDQDDLIRRRPG